MTLVGPKEQRKGMLMETVSILVLVDDARGLVTAKDNLPAPTMFQSLFLWMTLVGR